MQTESFSDAVASTIAQFTQKGQSFSAYDITLALRNRVNNGELEIANAVREDVDNVLNTFRIEHNVVRSEVLGLYNRGVVPNHTEEYQKGPRGGYRYFRFIGSPVAPQITPVAVHTVATVSQPVALSPSVLQSKVENYLSHKHGLQINPTFKQIQSRLKGVTVTCVELEALVRSLGYGVLVSNTQSESQVVIKP